MSDVAGILTVTLLAVFLVVWVIGFVLIMKGGRP